MKNLHFGFMKILILSLITFLITTSCDVNEPKKNNPKPEGYQEDIEWPSLADSPWPMFQHDPQNTNRSKLEFPNQLNSVENTIYCNNLLAGCVLSENSILFNNSNRSYLYDYDQMGLTKNWEAFLGTESLTAPLVSKDKIYTTSQNKVYAFSKNGTMLWSLSFKTDYIYQTSLNIDKGGNVYVVTDKTLFKISPEGKIINQYFDEDINDGFNTTAISPDGNTIYLRGISSSIIAVDINSFTVTWRYGDNKIFVPPIIDSQGNIYLFLSDFSKNLYLVSLNSNGTLRWKFRHFEDIEAMGYPAISKYGDIIFGFDTLYSVSYNGKLNWKKILTESNQSHYNSLSAITTDKSGNIFAGIFSNKLFLLNKNGEVKSEFQLSSYGYGLLPVIYSGSKIVASVFKGERVIIIN